MTVKDRQGPLYPDIEVELIGQDGNAMVIIGRVSKALRRAGVPAQDIEAFQKEATSGNYDQVLAAAENWVTVT
jgi:hypothetical protein